MQIYLENSIQRLHMEEALRPAIYISQLLFTMGFKQIWTKTTLAQHYRAIKAAPKEIFWNRWLIMTTLVYAMGGIPLSKQVLVPTDDF